MKADLHCHSHYSDGTLTPTDVVKLAAQNDVEMLALTDHDSINGLLEAQKQADIEGICLIKGIEFSTTWIDSIGKQHTIHIVGLNINPKHPTLETAIQANQHERIRRAQLTLEKLKELDINIEDSINAQIPEQGILTRTHIARALIDTKYAKNFDQAFKKYLGKSKRAFIEGQWLNLETIVSAINNAGGMAVIAHPMRYRLSATRLDKLVEEFSNYGGQGIEVVTATQDVNQQARAAQLAKLYNLYASVGSDFHSLDQPWAMLGRCPALPGSIEPIWKQFN